MKKEVKMIAAMIISNLLVYFLCRPSEQQALIQRKTSPEEIEIRIKAELKTPYEQDKKILLLSSEKRTKIIAKLVEQVSETEFIITVHRREGMNMTRSDDWFIYPFFEFKNPTLKTEQNYEIYY